MEFSEILDAQDHRGQYGLILFFVLIALEGILISLFVNKIPGQQAVLFTGFSIRSAMIPAGMLLISTGLLLIMGWFAIRKPQVFTNWIAWIKKPLVFQVCSYGTGATFFLSWLAVLGWDETLDRLIGNYSAIYVRVYPLLLWALFFSIQAGLSLWFISLPAAGTSHETIPIGLEKRKPILAVAAVIVPLLLYGVLVKLYIPKPIGEIFRYDLTFISVPALILLYFAFRQSGWKGTLIGLVSIMVMAGFALSYLWNSGTSEEPVVMGLFPYLDPSNYYADALRILDGRLIGNFGGRPLFSGFLSLVLGLTGRNLQISLAILVGITTVACYIAAREIGRNFGPAAAAFSMYLMFIFYRQFMGTTYTENLGLATGALALAFLLQGFRLKNYIFTLFGLFLTSFALNIRPGSFFMLPLLVLLFAWVFRSSNTFKSSVRPFLIGCGVILLAFFFNYLMDRSLSTPNYAMFSRFPQTFYGLAVGGKSWTQIYTDHPEVTKLVDPKLSDTIYALSVQQIRSNPGRFLCGLWKMGTDLFTVEDGAFTFIYGGLQIRLALLLLSLLGLGFLIARPKNLLHIMLLACFLGIVLSAPFVPARDSNRMRTYAVVIPFIVIFPALCFSWPNLWSKSIPSQNIVSDKNIYRSIEFIFTACLVVCTIAGPYLTKALSPTPNIQTTGCAAPDQAYYIRINPGSYVRIIDDKDQAGTQLPDLRIGDLTHSINDFSYSHIFNRQPYQPGTIITVTIDLLTGGKFWANIPAAGLPLDGSIVKICGKSIPNYYSIYTDSFNVVGK